ncbi:hypothetical protein MES4922_40035 [Mesorhizobium ventifaucium]|uniref:Uncharacterized protein n=1 Tax=Mesorhizobium ventifaucium TaxID=666020 RepID=A0ABN8K645_9HYPH|nr:hypothetical protein MES4922_40035 [Mesorhizobium ventifaucium]
MAAVTADSRGAALKVEPNRLSRLLYALASIGLLEVGRWRRHGASASIAGLFRKPRNAAAG